MKDLIKKQEEEFEGSLHAVVAGLLLNGFIQGSENEKLNEIPLNFAKKEFNKIISKVRKETAEYICDKMTGEEMEMPEHNCGNSYDCPHYPRTDAHNQRIKKEKEIKQDILKEFNIGGKQNETRTQRSTDLSE